MKKYKFITIAVLAIFLLSMPLLSGCGKVAQWADPMVENVLVSINIEDYSSFIKDFGDDLIKEVPRGKYPEVTKAT